MSNPELSIRLTICTPYGPVGARISRGLPMPRYESTYPDTPEGREQAERDLINLRTYIDACNKHKTKGLRR